MKSVIWLMPLCILATACSPISNEAKATLSKAPNCATAQQDMQILEEEYASVGKQIATGATNIIPVGAVIRIVKGEWREGAQVATGKYNRMIKTKMLNIHELCLAPLPESMAGEFP